MSHTYQKLNTQVCQAPWAYMVGFGTSALIPGTLVVSYGICMKST